MVSIIAIVMLMTGLTLIQAPTADAQAPPTFRIDLRVPAGTSCPSAHTQLGTVTIGDPRLDGTWCRPDGFTSVPNAFICNQAIAQGVPGAAWLGEGAFAGCTWWAVSVATGTCPAPLSLHRGVAPSGIRANWCGGQILVDSSPALTAPIPVCIESDFIQDDPTLAELGLNEYMDAKGVEYLITTGPPTCEFNCHGGFDANCDDVLGDYCPVHLNVNTVKGVAACLAALAPPAEAPDSVPAAAIEAATAQAYSGPALAVSGSESSVLAFIGSGLLGFGAIALGTRRRLNGVALTETE